MRIAILGAGISGLSAGYFLKKQFPTASFTFFEKKGRCGGVIETLHKPYHFERGPRTFSAAKSPLLIQLAEEFDVSFAFQSHQKRYVYRKGHLHEMNLPFLLKTNGFSLLQGAFRDLLHPRGVLKDETIAEFASRHFNSTIVEEFLDVLLQGIYAAKADQLSVAACFPKWKHYEQEYGSILKGYWRNRQKNKPKGLLSFTLGLEELTKKISETLNAEFRFDEEVRSIDFHNKQVAVNGETMDLVVSALNPKAYEQIAMPSKWKKQMAELKYSSIDVVHLAFSETTTIPLGFGYLCDPRENEGIYGVVFDSYCLKKDGTRVSVMMPPQKNQKEIAIRKLRQHLHISSSPEYVEISSYPNAIPLFPVGWKEKTKWEEGNFYVAGNFVKGVSVEDCIARAKEISLLAKKKYAQ